MVTPQIAADEVVTDSANERIRGLISQLAVQACEHEKHAPVL